VTERQDGSEPAPVSLIQGTKQAGETPARWAWVEPSVWTPRMLTALEHGVKGGQWYSLMDKVYSPQTLRAAFARVKANKGAGGVDRQTIESFEARHEKHVGEIAEALKEGRFQPMPVRRTYIPKPGSAEKRPLGIPTVRDRVVQTALRSVLEPIFERDAAEHSYGFRPGRGCKDALRRVDALLKQGHHWVVDADIKSYFDTIPHEALLDRVRAKVSDGKVLDLLHAYLKQEVMESMKRWTPEEGTPQGAVISPLLSNIYLDPLDQEMAQAGYAMIRYADDFVILCRTEAEAQEGLARVQEWMAQAGLTLHPVKTRIVDASQPGGFDFLGYHFEQGQRWPRKKSLDKLKDAVRCRTKRTNGHSLADLIANLNRTLIGWFGYFKHSHPYTFDRLDPWIRMRLRSLLRRRRGGRGRGRGLDHQRWPNGFFTEQGLFSLVEAHARARQSSSR
jgi:RNA-directed DNA polymerase